jgi:2-iminobutanoate/2-iminopropanoate deaminase
MKLGRDDGVDWDERVDGVDRVDGDERVDWDDGVDWEYLNLLYMKKIIHTNEAPEAIGPYSQAIEINGTLYISGQIPVNPASGKMVKGGITEQTTQVMKNIGAILKAAGYAYTDVVKSTCLLASMDDFKAMNIVYGSYYPENPPARAAFAVNALPLGALIEIETIAAK